MNALVTGANGFVGKAVMAHLKSLSCQVVGGVRHTIADRGFLTTPALEPQSDWSEVLRDIKWIVHCAGRAHVSAGNSIESTAEFYRVNAAGTLNLAQQAATSGVKRLVFISSIGVNGQASTQPFRETDQPNPREVYAKSKFEAEQGLRNIAAQGNMEVTIIRPPLIYGPAAPGNFGRLVEILHRGIPLPFGAIHNKRSLIGIDNLIDLIAKCLFHPAAANQTFLASDGEDLSTTDLMRRIGLALDKPVRLLPVPVPLLMVAASIVGKRELAEKICNSLQIDISKVSKLIGWNPPISVDEGLRRVARQFS
jgi:nucleoside-diphosphate-sugar epimerase